MVRRRSHERRATVKLRPEQERAVNEAERLLTPSEKERTLRRFASRIVKVRESQRSNEGEQSKGNEGKGPDPKNWGALDDSDGELDLDAQHAALASWNAAYRFARGKRERSRPSNPMTQETPNLPKGCGNIRLESTEVPDKRQKKSEKKEKPNKEAERTPKVLLNPVKDMVDRLVRRDDKRRERQRTPKAMETVKHINPKSYLGLALKRLERSKNHLRNPRKKKAKIQTATCLIQ